MENICSCTKSKILYISYARVIAMFCVIIVHLCQQSMNSNIVALAQFFIAGVTIFIILTGVLYGKKANDENYPQNIVNWLVERSKKILIPYYIYIVIVLLLDVFLKEEKNILLKGVMFLTCIQDFCGDFFYSIQGTGHLWYLTMLVLQYLLLTILFKFRKYVVYNFKWLLFLIGLYIIQICFTVFIQPKVGRYMFYILLGFISFYIAFEKINVVSKKFYFIFTALTGGAWIFRIYLYFEKVDNLLYTNVYSYYTQAMISIWVILSIYMLETMNVLKHSQIIRRIDEISFEVFLIHFIFIDGPLRIIGIFDNLIIEGGLIVVFSLFWGWVLHNIGEAIQKFKL